MNTLNLYTKSILDLYNTDERRGDCLLAPQRWCNRNWNRLLFDSWDNSNVIFQAAKRIIKIALLIIPTVISYVIGVAGAMIKLCSNHPKPLTNNQSKDPILVKLKPLPRSSFLAIRDPSNTKEITLSVFLNERVNIDPIMENQDILIYIASYLTPRDLITLMPVTKLFYNVTRSPIFWSPFLKPLDDFMFGARIKKLETAIYNKNTKNFEIVENQSSNNPFEVLMKSHRISKSVHRTYQLRSVTSPLIKWLFS